LTLRLDLTDEGLERGLNRTELWSPIPADDDDFNDFKKIAWLRGTTPSPTTAPWRTSCSTGDLTRVGVFC